jgi:hypothetical protein
MRIKTRDAEIAHIPESWHDDLLVRALRLPGRTESRFKWYRMWANKFTNYLAGKLPQQATQEDAERFRHVSTTMIYSHVLNQPGLAVRSPASG